MESAPPPPQQAEPHSYPGDSIHLVRTVTLANLQLSQMADQKASILMGATFLVFTLSVGQASRGEASPALLVMAFFAFISAVLAVATIMPAVRPPPVNPGHENILFFGVFSQLSEEEFTERVMLALRDSDGVYRTMLRDIWQNGQVLQRKKYRLLGYAYRTFLTGMTLTLLTFLATWWKLPG